MDWQREQAEMFAQSAALMAWFKSQRLGPEDSIPCMTLTIASILAFKVKESDDEVMVKKVFDMLTSGMKLIREIDKNKGRD